MDFRPSPTTLFLFLLSVPREVFTKPLPDDFAPEAERFQELVDLYFAEGGESC